MTSILRLLLALCLVCSVARVGYGQALDRGAVEAFFDRAWADTLRADGVVPGAVITVVHDGSVVLNKGYGVRDVDRGEPVDPATTRIRIGSTSKLFSALTLLALVDRGRINLDRDVNDYLTTVTVPKTYDTPVTLRLLLSHRAGFEAGVSGYMTQNNNDIATRPDAYQRHVIRAHPPDREYGYDNLAVGLMGHLAGVVTQTSFARAVDEMVTAPLGLRHTTMGVPDWQREHLAGCHSWDVNGRLVKCPPRFMKEGYQAAGDITTTGADMARLMLALLNGGCLDGTCVLKADTFAQFTDLNLNRLHPAAAGMGFLIYEKHAAGRLAMGHDGAQHGFTTSLILFPETRTGILINLLSSVGIPDEWDLRSIVDLARRGSKHRLAQLQSETEARFAATFLPERTSVTPLPPGSAADMDLAFLGGRYIRTPTHGDGSMLLSRMLSVAAGLDVAVNGDRVFVDGEGPFRHTGGGVLEMDGSDVHWLFTRTTHDLVLQASGDLAPETYVQKPWHWDAWVTVLPLMLPGVIAIPALVFSLVQRRTRLSRTVGWLCAGSALAVSTGLYLELQYFAVNYFPEGPTLALAAWRMLLHLGWLGAVALVFLVVTHPRQLLGFRSAASFGRFVLVVLFTASAVVIAVLLPYWGLIGQLRGV